MQSPICNIWLRKDTPSPLNFHKNFCITVRLLKKHRTKLSRQALDIQYSERLLRLCAPCNDLRLIGFAGVSTVQFIDAGNPPTADVAHLYGKYVFRILRY